MSSLKIKTSWDLSPFFDSDNDSKIESQRKESDEALDKFIKKWKSDENYLVEPKVMKQALDEFEKFHRLHGTASDEYAYFWLKHYQNLSDSEAKARFNKAQDRATKIGNDLLFFTMNLAKIPQANQEAFLKNPELTDYKHFLEKIFESEKHLLSEEGEKIMNLKSETSYDAWEKLTSTLLSKEEAEVLDEDGKIVKKNFEEIQKLTRSKNKSVRDAAAKAINEILKKHADVAEMEMNALLANKKTNDELRKYSRSDESRHISDDIESSVVDSLSEAVSSKFKIANDFYKLKARLLGLKKLEYHERNVEYGSIDKKYPFEESVNLIYKTFKNLDEEFASLFKMFVETGKIDAFPKKGKRGGAFCVHFRKTNPTYILLNHTETLNDVKTIAHESGHAINHELMKKQNALNYGIMMSTAEVASTFMEDFVLQELLKSADDEMRLAIQMEKLNDDISTIFRQTSCYRFEQELHKTFREKGYLSKEEIGKIFQKHMSAYMGEFVEQSDGSENWWVLWPHIRDHFYVYSYSSGLLISKAMQSKVKHDHKFIEHVKEFLSTGQSKSAKDTFVAMGIDITDKNFWMQGLGEVEELLKDTEKLARKLGK